MHRLLSRRGFLFGAGVLAGGFATAGLLPLFRRDRSMERLAPGHVLTVLGGRDESDGQQRHALIELWNAHYGRTHPAQLVEVSSNADLAYSTMLSTAQAGDARVDVYNLDIPWVPLFAEEGFVRELDGIERAGFLAAPWRAGVWNGALHALPFNSDVGLLYYNADLLEEYYRLTGSTPEPDLLPAAWPELAEFAGTVAGRLADVRTPDRPAVEAGITLQLSDYEGFTVGVWEALQSAGAVSLDHAGYPVLGDGVGEALARMASGLGTAVLEDSLAFDEQGSLAAFVAGRTVFLRHWPRALRVLRGMDAAGFRVGVARLPGAVLGGQSLAVSSASRYPVAAQRLVEFLTNERSQQVLFERGGFASSRWAPYDDPSASWAPGAEEAGEDSSVVVPSPDDAKRVLADALDTAPTRPRLLHYAVFSETFRAHVRPVLTGDRDPDPDRLARAVEAAVDGRIV
ncbi:extracellular solute-binding protein [Myceligenerans pegani]|uniref:Extracellular solute-binding protein n=1 Tax=Myceligenerans pegani TaxID=2776917 RepID=A0ABR9MWU9_9MICO|nr:extracellular solute-binding protein [Myceligenerans sp. TRM 65318]MBE1875869.1 extracellular solute-binding protein [Myceligenerans sp. TRM 65318]MBE3018140.1 extracellular solute-binding protein [Myceligenerans sp. TRM 65318]